MFATVIHTSFKVVRQMLIPLNRAEAVFACIFCAKLTNMTSYLKEVLVLVLVFVHHQNLHLTSLIHTRK